jgi:hypothetical protein
MKTVGGGEMKIHTEKYHVLFNQKNTAEAATY